MENATNSAAPENDTEARELEFSQAVAKAIARLKARPVTNYCIDCKTKQEAFERVTGG